ncbi:unnamed protein product [Effrenium voratum]|uniref:Uncharacterized protein n=1 Tax=Effrenium voratum TaxID=2562239 RepID=A0AA36MQZ4_9DINO|nr:unnamed protein product [Effrenium voratum]
MEGASKCWSSKLNPLRCCLGTTWGAVQEQVDACWTQERTFASCCLSERMLMRSELWAWKNNFFSCGCNISQDVRSRHAFCRLRDMLAPDARPECMTYSYTYILELVTEFGRLFRVNTPLLQSKDLALCVPGMFIIMLTDLLARMPYEKNLTQLTSFHYVNHVFPYALKATSELAAAGWNVIPVWQSVKAMAHDLRYGGTEPIPGTAAEDAFQLRRAAAAVPPAWRLHQWGSSCSRCCLVPASLALAGLGSLRNKERLDRAVHFMAQAAQGDWVTLLLWSPWPVLEILETFLPWRQRVIGLVTVQTMDQESSCFGQTVSQVPPVKPKAATSRRAAVVLRGRSFFWRRGGEHLNLPESVPEQLLAARSHMSKVVKPLEALGYEVSIYGATYETAFLQRLEAEYQPKLAANFSRLPLPGSQRQGVEAALNLVPSDSALVVLLRFDLVLKRSLGPFLAAWPRQEFLAPFWCELSKISLLEGGSLCVSDVLQIFPGHELARVQQALGAMESPHGHAHFHDWLQLLVEQGVLPNQVGVLVPGRFIADPGAQWNPLYDFANRDRRSPPPGINRGNWT